MTVNTGEGFRFDHAINFDVVTITNGNLDYLGPEHGCHFAVAPAILCCCCDCHTHFDHVYLNT